MTHCFPSCWSLPGCKLVYSRTLWGTPALSTAPALLLLQPSLPERKRGALVTRAQGQSTGGSLLRMDVALPASQRCSRGTTHSKTRLMCLGRAVALGFQREGADVATPKHCVHTSGGEPTAFNVETSVSPSFTLSQAW